MVVLVTGGAGYIGSHMVWELLDAGENVIVLDSLSTGFKWAVPPDARLVVGDVADKKLVADLIGSCHVDSIIHFAGSVVVPESVSNPLTYYDNNTARTRTLIETAVRTGVTNFVFSSTAAVYGETNLKPITENGPLVPGSPYGRSKLMCEWMLADSERAYGLRYVALRYFNVAGADPCGRAGQSTVGATHLIKVACETAMGKRSHVEVFGTDYPTRDGTCIRDYIHVSDLTAAHLGALRRIREGGESLVANCGYNHGYSVLEVLESVKRLHGRDIEVRYGARRPGDVAAVVADSTLARSALDWQPRYDDIDFIVATALGWERHLFLTCPDEVARFQS